MCDNVVTIEARIDIMLLMPHKKNSQALYEQNYRRLVDLFPEIYDVSCSQVCYELGASTVKLELVEQTRYTTALDLHIDSRLGDMMPGCHVQVRLYHDARVAEVLAYQGHRCIQPHYNYPNDNMYHRDEKRQINLLLKDLLQFVDQQELICKTISSVQIALG